MQIIKPKTMDGGELPKQSIVKNRENQVVSHERNNYRHLLPLWLMFSMGLGYLVLERSPKSTNNTLKATRHGVITKFIGVGITKCWTVRCKCLALTHFWRKNSSKSSMVWNGKIVAMQIIKPKTMDGLTWKKQLHTGICCHCGWCSIWRWGIWY